MLAWEYRLDKVSVGGINVPNIDSVTNAGLNASGKYGWELFGVLPMARSGGLTQQVYLLFKRPTTEDALSDEPPPIVTSAPSDTESKGVRQYEPFNWAQPF